MQGNKLNIKSENNLFEKNFNRLKLSDKTVIDNTDAEKLSISHESKYLNKSILASSSDPSNSHDSSGHDSLHDEFDEEIIHTIEKSSIFENNSESLSRKSTETTKKSSAHISNFSPFQPFLKDFEQKSNSQKFHEIYNSNFQSDFWVLTEMSILDNFDSLITNHYNSKLLQDYISLHPDILIKLFPKLVPFLIKYSNHIFGNYFIQKLIEFGDATIVRKLLKKVID